MTSLCVEWCYASSGPSDYQHHLGLLHIYEANKIKQKRKIVAIYGICYAACKCMQYVCVGGGYCVHLCRLCLLGASVCLWICVSCVYWFKSVHLCMNVYVCFCICVGCVY